MNSLEPLCTRSSQSDPSSSGSEGSAGHCSWGQQSPKPGGMQQKEWVF